MQPQQEKSGEREEPISGSAISQGLRAVMRLKVVGSLIGIRRAKPDA